MFSGIAVGGQPWSLKVFEANAGLILNNNIDRQARWLRCNAFLCCASICVFLPLRSRLMHILPSSFPSCSLFSVLCSLHSLSLSLSVSLSPSLTFSLLFIFSSLPTLSCVRAACVPRVSLKFPARTLVSLWTACREAPYGGMSSRIHTVVGNQTTARTHSRTPWRIQTTRCASLSISQSSHVMSYPCFRSSARVI